MLVAVYGTLKQGNHNNYIIGDAKYLGDDILYNVTLYDLGPFPAAKLKESNGSYVEIYDCNDVHIQNMDFLEGYDETDPVNSFYVRTTITTKYGETYIYIFNRIIYDEPVVLNWKKNLT